ncbi:MAG: hypothetical protein PHF86_14635 [Candidatus Nanoarchaeia archaeon]|jgi:hypothetical protein|nr:hypothetical protein [Candidatus Nanoarchaeia archaeon]
MYIIPDLINLGLKDDQQWPTEAHKVVAQNLLLCRPEINDRDILIQCVQIILTVPIEKIETITLEELIKDYNFPAF